MGDLTFDSAIIAAGTFQVQAQFTVPAGAICALIGPSGAGKSTVLAGAAGFAPVTSGDIMMDGQAIQALPPAQRPVTLLFQDNNLFPALTVAQNVGLGLRPSLSLTAMEHKQVDAVLDQVGLGDLASRRPAALSGGQRQRAALARALLRDRPALLLDEPFAALGPGLRRDMLDLTARAARGRNMAVLMVTHHPEDAQRGADLTAFCGADGQGGGVIDGARPTAEVFADPPPELAAYV